MSVPTWLLEALAAAGVPLVPACSTARGTDDPSRIRHVPGVPAEPPSNLEITADLQEAIEERAAILEFDGGLSRSDADQRARAMVVSSRRRTLH